MNCKNDKLEIKLIKQSSTQTAVETEFISSNSLPLFLSLSVYLCLRLSLSVYMSVSVTPFLSLNFSVSLISYPI